MGEGAQKQKQASRPPPEKKAPHSVYGGTPVSI